MTLDFGIMTEAQVADELGCSVAKIRKLRAAGELAFIPGRPVLVLRPAFLELQRRETEKAAARRKKRKKGKRATEPPSPPRDPDHDMRVRIAMIWFKIRRDREKRALAARTKA